MTAAAIALSVLVAAVLLFQCAVVIRYAAMLRALPRAAPEDDQFPRAAVVLSLRGVDPYFADSIATLLDQNYPEYDVHIVVDNERDEAWRAIEDARPADLHSRMHTRLLRNPASTCSLKNSALIQVVQSLDASYKVVAFFDGDVVPHREWLRDMVAPLTEPGVGATTGNRWYCPQRPSWGSLVRQVWNVGAVVQMWVNRMVWAGSMAIRSEAIRESNLLEVWGRSMSTDSVVYSRMRQAGYTVAPVPEAIMVNREEISLVKFVRWVGRQLLMARLYHPGWLLVVLQTLFIAGLQLSSLALVVCSLATQQWLPGVISAATLIAYWTASCVFVCLVDRAVSLRVSRRGEQTQPLTVTWLVRLIPSMVITNVAFPWAMLTAMTQREIVWRGITYTVRGPFQVEMARYHPFRSADGASHSSVL